MRTRRGSSTCAPGWQRVPLGLALLAGVALPAACGGEDGASFAFPSVSSSELGAEPTVVSSTAPPKETQLQVLREGTGRAIGASDVLVTDAKSQVWKTDGAQAQPYLNTFAGGRRLISSVQAIVPGWGKALPGVKVGSRVLLVTPPADGFGKEGNAGAGIAADDSLIFVIDILDAVPADTMASGTPAGAKPAAGLPVVGSGVDPTITVPKGDPPRKLTKQILLAGRGDRIAAGQQVLAQYTGVRWRDGGRFDSSWEAGRGPFAVRVAVSDPRTGEPGVIKGWVDGLVDQRVGSRLLLVVPPALGYGAAGNTGAGITGTDTLVFVIDILGVYGTPS